MESPVQFTTVPTQLRDEFKYLPADDDGSNLAAETQISQDEMAVWTWLVSKGIVNAMAGLSRMVGNEIKVTSLTLEHLSAKDALDLLGKPEDLTVGVYLTIHGDATGHLLLMHDPKIAYKLIDIQLGLPLGSTQKLEKLECSILGEMGNVTGTFFLNALADANGLVLMPSPPAVMIDMIGAIMNIPLTFIMEKQEEALVVKTTFSTDSQQIAGTFMVLPTLDFMKTILRHSGS
ncbi:MAG: chemotaxis protein CheC [Dehalococcoidales bacterium]